jgi:hypothetical protein
MVVILGMMAVAGQEGGPHLNVSLAMATRLSIRRPYLVSDCHYLEFF